MAPRKSAAQEGKVSSGTFLDLDAAEQKRRDDPEFSIKVGGVVYPMTTSDDLTIAQKEDLERAYTGLLHQRDQAGDEHGLLTDEQYHVTSHLERRMIRIALPDMPPDVLNGLNDHLRGQIVKVFTSAVNHSGFLTQAMVKLRRELTPTRPTLVPGNAGATTANSESAPSPDSSSKAEAA